MQSPVAQRWEEHEGKAYENVSELEIAKINTSANSFADKGGRHMTRREMSLALTLTRIAIKCHGRSIFFGKQRRLVSLHWLQNKTIQNILDLVWGNKYCSGYDKSDNEKLSKVDTKQRSLEQSHTYRKSGIALMSITVAF